MILILAAQSYQLDVLSHPNAFKLHFRVITLITRINPDYWNRHQSSGANHGHDKNRHSRRFRTNVTANVSDENHPEKYNADRHTYDVEQGHIFDLGMVTSLLHGNT